jgi:sterol desaturase/sphingolipid hydroxylase (fatty acid hydroxylase superfamily)
MTLVLDMLLAAAWLAAIFVPLEWALPARADQPRLRRELAVDAIFFASQYLVWAAVAVAVLTVFADAVDGIAALEGVRSAFARMPLALQAALALVLGDVVVYFGHRWQHASDFLWRFHRVHHTAETLDWVAAHREHPLDGLFTQTLVNIPAILLGLPIEAVLGLVVFRSLWAILIHANVRLPLGPLALLVGSPQLHHWHHAKGRDVGNYANLAPWLDVVFGTYCLPRTPPPAVGLSEPAPRGYLGLLLAPFRRAA